MKNQCPIFTENVILIKKEDFDEEAVEMESTKLQKQYKMNVEEKVKINLLTRGFDNNTLLNNRGLIRATIDETILEVVKNLGIADVGVRLSLPDADNYDYLRGFVDGYGGEEPHDVFPEGFKDINEIWDRMCELKGNEA